jgi:hypothetical protein
VTGGKRVSDITAIVRIGAIVKRAYSIPLVHSDDGWLRGSVPRNGENGVDPTEIFVLNLHRDHTGLLELRRVNRSRLSPTVLMDWRLYHRGDGVTFECRPDERADELTTPVFVSLCQSRRWAEEQAASFNQADGKTHLSA